MQDYEHLRINKKIIDQLELVEDLAIGYIHKTGERNYGTCKIRLLNLSPFTYANTRVRAKNFLLTEAIAQAMNTGRILAKMLINIFFIMVLGASGYAGMDYPRYNFSAVPYQNKIYAIGGYNLSYPVNLPPVEIYDIPTQNWILGPATNQPTAGVSCVEYDGYIYCFQSTTVKRLNVAQSSNSWETVTTQNVNTGTPWGGGAVIVGTKAYLANTYDSNLYYFDFSTMSGAVETILPNQRSMGFGICTLNKIVYLVGGTGYGAYIIMGYNTISKTWQNIPGLNTYYNSRTACYDGNFYVVGGGGYPTNYCGNEVVKFSPSDGSATLFYTLAEKRGEMATAVVSNKLYIIGGQRDDGSVSGSVEVITLPESNGNQAFLQFIQPNGGEILYKGTDYRIKWNWSNYTGYIRIHAYLDDVYYATLAANEPVENGDQGIVFNPPIDWPSSDKYKIVISTVDNQASAESVGYFTITELPRFLTLPLRTQAVVGNGWEYNDQQGSHCGIDYFVPKGTPVVASTDGYATADYQVDETGYGFGNLVIIRHDETDKNGAHFFTLYAHLSEFTKIPKRTDSRFQAKQGLDPVSAGWTRVRRGQQIGKSGDSGGQTWPHLHFAVLMNWKVRCQMGELDPYDLYAKSTADVNSSDHYPPKMTRTIGGKTRSSGSLYTVSGPNRLWTSDPPSTQSALPWLPLLLSD